MKVVVIGAGLSGLTSAVALREARCDVSVFEARAEVGGRIRSVRGPDGTYLADLGPTWVWPAHQPVVRKWMSELDVPGNAQFDDGLTIVEQGGQAPALMQLPSQDGSVRPIGGPQALVDALAGRLPVGSIKLGSPISHVEVDAVGVHVTANGERWSFDKAVVALPPRIAASAVAWSPGLPDQLFAALRGAPTWMAPHAKAVALFVRPFWRERGLAGRILSRVGPLVEVHDHCGPDGAPAALFGFVGVPAAERGAGLEGAIRAQLARCFGADAPVPFAVHVEDWASDPLVATAADLAGAGAHPTVQPEVLRHSHFGGRVAFAGAETAVVSPGLIEGALAAGSHAAELTLKR